MVSLYMGRSHNNNYNKITDYKQTFERYVHLPVKEQVSDRKRMEKKRVFKWKTVFQYKGNVGSLLLFMAHLVISQLPFFKI